MVSPCFIQIREVCIFLIHLAYLFTHCTVYTYVHLFIVVFIKCLLSNISNVFIINGKYTCNTVSALPGKDVLYNIVAFAKESVSAHVTTLRPENFPSDGKEPWIVDFFAPVSISLMLVTNTVLAYQCSQLTTCLKR